MKLNCLKNIVSGKTHTTPKQACKNQIWYTSVYLLAVLVNYVRFKWFEARHQNKFCTWAKCSSALFTRIFILKSHFHITLNFDNSLSDCMTFNGSKILNIGFHTYSSRDTSFQIYIFNIKKKILIKYWVWNFHKIS